jgi:hypothetical protein
MCYWEVEYQTTHVQSTGATSTCNPPCTVTRGGLSVHACAVPCSAGLVISTPQPSKCKHKHIGATRQLLNYQLSASHSSVVSKFKCIHDTSCHYTNPQSIFKVKAAPIVTWTDKEFNSVTHVMLRSMTNIQRTRTTVMSEGWGTC